MRLMGPNYTELSEQWIDSVVQDRNEDDNGERVEVVEHIIGNTIRGEGCGLSVCCSPETSIVDLLNGEEEEDSTSAHCPSRIINELIVPCEGSESEIAILNTKVVSINLHRTILWSPSAAITEGLTRSQYPARPNPLIPAFLKASMLTAKKSGRAEPPGGNFTRRLLTINRRTGSMK
jgi:hypothetical protein